MEAAPKGGFFLFETSVLLCVLQSLHDVWTPPEDIGEKVEGHPVGADGPAAIAPVGAAARPRGVAATGGPENTGSGRVFPGLATVTHGT